MSALFVKDRHVVVPIIIAMCFLPADISLNIIGLNFQAVRIMAIICLFKVYFSSNRSNIKFNMIDKLFIGYNILGSVLYIIASSNNIGAFVFKSGIFIDSIILYIVLRKAIQSNEEIKLIIRTFIVCVIVLLPFAIYEFTTASNLFSILGRNRIALREGGVRVACTFSHSILFGSFAATLIPIIWADYKIEKKLYKIIALLSCLFYVYASLSSGPIITLAGAICFLIFFRWKKYSSYLAWFIFLAATLIHFVREKPLWHFIYLRLSVRSGSTGIHRYLLTDAAVQEFWNWWLIGYGDVGPQWHLKYWPRTHAKFTDITNQYLLEGVRGGFFTMLLFTILCFTVIKTLTTFSISRNDKSEQWLWWGFAVMMIAHCITFLSVSYFGQITMLLYMTIAIAAFAHDKSKINLEQTN